MVEKGLERESVDVMAGAKAGGLKRFIVRIVMFKITMGQKSDGQEKQECNCGILYIQRGIMYEF